MFVAKALADDRALDLPFSPAFIKLLRGDAVTLQDWKHVDAAAASAIARLDELRAERECAVDKSSIDAKIAGLMMTCQVPGCSEAMRAGRLDAETDLSGNNISAFLHGLVEDVLVQGTAVAVDNFRRGYSRVGDLRGWSWLTVAELRELMGGSEGTDADWRPATVLAHVTLRKYTPTSPPLEAFLHVISNFDKAQRRSFLRFLTGAPRLPAGGWGALSPRLTIVRADPAPGCSADDPLPTVSACHSYLKLPPYSNEETLRRKLLYSMSEGIEFAFD
jgi:E3 ubiquitin-protein ligase TRIP12